MEITRKAQLNQFQDWLLGPSPQRARGGTGRGFRHATAWCWAVPMGAGESTGVVHEQLMLDGTYFNGWCVLIAYTGTHVVDWQWCDREKKHAWEALLGRIPAPGLVIVDGGAGIHAALSAQWPHTLVQRCFFHVHAAITRHLTRAPRLEPGRQLRALTQALMRIQDLDQAAVWLGEYASWEARWEGFLKQRSYLRPGMPRPEGVGASQQWWYTHPRLRRARALMRNLIRHGNLFAWLDPALEGIRPAGFARTTSPLEGGPNKAIKELLRAHRGMPEQHARTAVDWLLNSLTQTPVDPWSRAHPQHWNPPRTQAPVIWEQPEPVLYDQGFSWEDGNGLQHGWAGRTHQ